MDSRLSSSRITDHQYEIMLTYIANNRQMLSRKFNAQFNKYDKETHWSKLSQILNKDDPNNLRSPDRWKKGWSDWKNRVKSKARKYGIRGLSPLEKRLYNLAENLQEGHSVATTSEGISTSSSTSFSLHIEHEQESRRSIDVASNYSDSDISLLDLAEELSGNKEKDSEEGVEQERPNISTERRINLDEQVDCKIAEELRKWREQDERKIKVLQKIVDEQEKTQLTLIQVVNTLKKMLDVQEEIPKALRGIANKSNLY